MSTAGPRPPRNVVTSTAYDKDAKRVRKRGQDMARLVAVVDLIRRRERLAVHHRDHALSGDWAGHRECHIQADWVLVYSLDDTTVRLARTGTHSDIFGK